MDRIRELLGLRPSYEPLLRDEGSDGSADDENGACANDAPPFSYVEYVVFVWLGIAMLWAWNMFLAAAPYLQRRFRSNKTILANFQATELLVATLANLGSMLVLSKLQAGAIYPRRIKVSLLINLVTFTLLAVSTRAFLNISAAGYFGFVIVMIFATSLATGFMQNGSFAFASGYGRPEYMQGIMLGQGVAGVLPPIVQIVSVLSASGGQTSSTSAFAYFMTATGICATTLAAFWYLDAKHKPQPSHMPIGASQTAPASEDSHQTPAVPEYPVIKQSASFTYLFGRLFYPATAVFLTFAITMVFPVFTQEILSVDPDSSPILKDAAFIPLGFLIWNIGDLLGRATPLVPRLSLASRPRILLMLSLVRLVFIPLYLICNVQPSESSGNTTTQGLGVAMPDLFYLLVVQFPFGLSNGYLGTCCMSGAAAFVEEDRREAAGGFMGLMLVSGLAVGSLCSFFVGN